MAKAGFCYISPQNRQKHSNIKRNHAPERLSKLVRGVFRASESKNSYAFWEKYAFQSRFAFEKAGGFEPRNTRTIGYKSTFLRRIVMDNPCNFSKYMLYLYLYTSIILKKTLPLTLCFICGISVEQEYIRKGMALGHRQQMSMVEGLLYYHAV